MADALRFIGGSDSNVIGMFHNNGAGAVHAKAVSFDATSDDNIVDAILSDATDFVDDAGTDNRVGAEEILRIRLPGVQTAVADPFRFVMPYNGQVASVTLTAGTAPTGAALIGNVNKNGTTIYAVATNPQIAAGSNDGTAAIPDLAASEFVTGDRLEYDTTQIGSTIAGSDLLVEIKVRRNG